MRKVLALVVLLCGAASANAGTGILPVPYCSKGFDKPAVMSVDGWVTIGGVPVRDDKPDEYTFGVLTPQGKDDTKQLVVIFRDRVFWPCP